MLPASAVRAPADSVRQGNSARLFLTGKGNSFIMTVNRNKIAGWAGLLVHPGDRYEIINEGAIQRHCAL